MMSRLFSLTVHVLVLLATIKTSWGGLVHEHDHGHAHSPDDIHQCACEAEVWGFPIDCDDTLSMIGAMSTLRSLNCDQACSSHDCTEAWMIVQTHHDYCPEAGLPEEIEDGIHDFEMECKPCYITRKPIDGLPDCPVADCEDSSGNTAYFNLLSNSCSSECSEACVSPFRILRAVHDTCPHEALNQEAEEGIHDFEVACAMVACNVKTIQNPLVCEEHVHGSGATSTVSVVTVLVAAIASTAVLFLL